MAKLYKKAKEEDSVPVKEEKKTKNKRTNKKKDAQKV